MTERELTLQNGLFQQLLGDDWRWERRPDVSHKHAAPRYYDGTIFNLRAMSIIPLHVGFPVEIKLQEFRLTKNEIKRFDELTKLGMICIVARYFKKDMWRFDLYERSTSYMGTVLVCMKYISSYYWQNSLINKRG